MDQLVQNLKDGHMEVASLPTPSVQTGQILVRNHYSVISTGTEGKTVSDARLNLMGKAIARKDEVAKVIDTARKIGIKQTFAIVKSRLEASSPLGYASAGEVIAVGAGIYNFKVGDRVACAGNSASHAEVISVPKNLAVRLNRHANLKNACFTTLGAIALQGIRQADVHLGEKVVVIGLGLIGQLTSQLLRASGVEVCGIDLDDFKTELARELGANLSLLRTDSLLTEKIEEWTNGQGADAVIITAAASNNDPVNLAGELARNRANVVIVGNVPTGFKRKNYYRKELNLKMSSSYGPGRYDDNYEEKGLDYPIGFVRWTENRNMQAFAALVDQEKINLEPLVTRVYDFEKAPRAYDFILEKQQPFMAVLLKYDIEKEIESQVTYPERRILGNKPNAGFIGLGKFATSFLLPHIKDDFKWIGVSNSKPHSTSDAAKKLNSLHAFANPEEIIKSSEVDHLFIATRHDSHFRLVKMAMEYNKHVFVEKPLCLTKKELQILKNTYSDSASLVMLGFNRRFSPYTQELKKRFDNHMPKSMQYRINAGKVDAKHWIHDPHIGGGRIVGEVVHFIDWCNYIAGSKIQSLSANEMQTGNNSQDTVCITLRYENGSVASINYFSNGNDKIPKEEIQVFCGGQTALINDFKILEIYGKDKFSKKGKQDKGHKAEMELWKKTLLKGGDSPVAFEDIYHSTLAAFKVIDSISGDGEKVNMN